MPTSANARTTRQGSSRSPEGPPSRSRSEFFSTADLWGASTLVLMGHVPKVLVRDATVRQRTHVEWQFPLVNAEGRSAKDDFREGYRNRKFAAPLRDAASAYRQLIRLSRGDEA